MAAARSRTPSLEKMAPTWVFTVASLTKSAAAISPLVAPRAMWRSTSCSRSVSSSSRAAPRRRPHVGPAGGVQHPGRHLGVEPGRAAGHGAGGGDQVVGRGVLEHEAGRAGVERAPEHVVVVEGREDQHGRRVAPRPEAAGGGHPVDPAHAHVHQHHVGPVGGDGVDHLVAVVALGHDLEPVLGPEDAGHPGPHDRLVVDDQHPDHVGTSDARRRPATGWEAGLDPPAVARRAGVELPAEGPGPLPHADEPKWPAPVDGWAAGVPVVDHPQPQPPHSSVFHGEVHGVVRVRGGPRWRAPRGRCGAGRCPSGPRVGGRRARRRASIDEPGAAVLVDERGEVGRPGQRRSVPRSSVRRAATVARIWSRLARRRSRRRSAPARPRRRRGAARAGRR